MFKKNIGLLESKIPNRQLSKAVPRQTDTENLKRMIAWHAKVAFTLNNALFGNVMILNKMHSGPVCILGPPATWEAEPWSKPLTGQRCRGSCSWSWSSGCPVGASVCCSVLACGPQTPDTVLYLWEEEMGQQREKEIKPGIDRARGQRGLSTKQNHI